MALGESVDSYYGRMEYLLQRWNNHQMPDDYLTGIFIGGLYPPEFRIAIKEKSPADLATALRYAKSYEEARISDDRQLTMVDPTIYPSSSYPPNPMYISNPGPPIPYPSQIQPQNYLNPAPLQMASVVPPTSNFQFTKKSEVEPHKVDHFQDEISKLTNAMHELRVQVTNAPSKRQKPTNTRTNVWCTNCNGQGHLPNECPSPFGSYEKPLCTFCGGNHTTNKCWNLNAVKKDLNVVKQVLQIDANKPWVNKGNPNKRPFTRPNVGPPYKPNDNRPRWNDTYNAPPVWKGPPSNPNTHNYGPPQRGKMVVCYRCGELGHYASECPNPRKPVDYSPFCSKCRQQGHLTQDCEEPPRTFPPSERDYPRKGSIS